MIEPHIVLNEGQANAAIKFYESVFHGKVISVFRLGDMPDNLSQPLPQHMKQLVGDCEIDIQGTILHISDMKSEGKTHDGHISLLIYLDTESELMRVYEMLKSDGEILNEVSPQPFAKMYAWVKDKFGVSWQILCR